MMYELPTKLKIGGVDYQIQSDGDYRMVINTFSILEDQQLDKNERIILALAMFYEDIECYEDIAKIPDIEEATKKMYEFFDAGRPEGGRAGVKLIDWDTDSSMVCSAINSVSGKEIRSLPYLHWWTFMGYYMSVGESTMSTVLSIRDKIKRGTKMEKWERKYKAENPQYFTWNSKTAAEHEAEDWVLAQWNKGA